MDITWWPDRESDWLCINRKFRRSLDNVRILRGADVGSDHHLIIAMVKIKLKKYKKENNGCGEKYQLNLLQEDNKRKEFQLELSNKFQALENLEELPIEEHWKEIKEVMTSTCSSILGPKEKKH